MSNNYFSNKARGGVVASNINYQDPIGVLLGAEILANKSIFTKENYKDWKIICESDDDMEIQFNKDKRVYIQVKNQSLSESILLEIVNNFKIIYEEKKNIVQDIKFNIAILKNLPNKYTDLPNKLDELHKAKSLYKKEEYEKKIDDLYDLYPKIEREILTRLTIKNYAFVKDKDKSIANFNYMIRQAYPIKDFGDEYLENIYKSILNLFYHARNERGSVSQEDFSIPILMLVGISSDPIELFGYKKDKAGYMKNVDLKRDYNDHVKSMKKTFKKIRKEWFIYTKLKNFKFFSLKPNYELCEKCGHPLIANFWGINGLACPDCGYFPFLTLIIPCICGEHYFIVKQQPELNNEKIFIYINDFVKSNNPICPKCHKILKDTNVEKRIMYLPYPLPVEEYKVGKIQEYIAKYV